MKQYTLKVFTGGSALTETIKAETHTIENGVYIFWVLNQFNEWAQIATYPIACTAITRVQEQQEIQTPAVQIDSTIKTNKTVDSADFMEVVTPQPSTKPKGRKK